MSVPPAAAPIPQPQRKQGRYFALAALLVACIAWWIFWGAPARLPGEILQTGSGVERPSPDFRPTSLHLASLKTHHGTLIVYADSSSASHRFLGSTVAVIAKSDHELAQQFAHEIYRELAKNPHFTEIYYLPPGKHLPIGEKLPHLFIHVDQRKLEQTGVLPYRKLNAILSVRVTSPLPAAAIRDGEGPPIPSINWASTVNATTKEIGLETASTRFRNVAQNLAKASVQHIEGYLRKYHDEYGFAAAPPPGFQPAFTPAPPFAFLDDLSAELLCSGPSFMRSNHSLWRIPAAKSKQALAMIEGKLSAANWTIQDKHPNRQTTVVQAKRGETESVDFFPENGTGDSTDRPEFERPWYLVYARGMSDDQIDTAFRALIADGASESTITWFEDLWPRNQQAVDAYFAKHPPQSLAALCYFALKSHRKENFEQARDYLLRAHVIACLQEDHGSPGRDIPELAQELGITLPRRPDVSALIAAGVIDMREDDQATHTVGNGDTAVFLFNANEERQSFLILVPHRMEQDVLNIKQRALRLDSSGAVGSSMGSSTLKLPLKSAVPIAGSIVGIDLNVFEPTVTIRQLPNDQFEFTVKYQRIGSVVAGQSGGSR